MTPAIVEQARAKVNLALHVIGRRKDGMHELDSIVAFADCGDRLSLQRSEITCLEITGPFAHQLPTDGSNLILKAYDLLAQQVSCPPVLFQLEKNLPVASGIGGGSADAAAALRGLLRLTGHGVSESQLTTLALKLGADVPVCLRGEAVRMRGVGEQLEAIQDISAKAIVLANPLQGCATASVFKALGLAPGQAHGTALDVHDAQSWRNDLTEPAISVVPEIAAVLRALPKMGAFSTVRMSGSGATCFGLMDDLESAVAAALRLQRFHPEWWVAAAPLATVSSS